MGIETITGASTEDDLNVLWPLDVDFFSQGSAHLRNIKQVLNNLFTAGVANNAAEAATLGGVGSSGYALVAGSTSQAFSALSLTLPTWSVTENAGVLEFRTGGILKMKLDASGNLSVTGDVNGFQTL